MPTKSFLVAVFLILVGHDIQSQLLVPFWDESDNFHSGLKINPAYHASAKVLISLPSNTSWTASRSTAPVFILSPVDYETNNSIWFGSASRPDKGLLQLGEYPFGNDLFKTAAAQENILAHHSSTAVGLSFDIGSHEEKISNGVLRFGFLAERKAEVIYDRTFAGFAFEPLFKDDPDYTQADLGDFEMNESSHWAVVIGFTKEIVPLKCFIGLNGKMLLGRHRLDVAVEPGGDTLSIRQSGYVERNGRLEESNVLINGSGGAADIGITYRINRTMTLGASVVDIGFIDWDDLEESRLGSDQEMVFGVMPLSNYHEGFPADEYQDVLDTTNTRSIIGSDDSRVWLNTRANLTFSSQFDKLGIHLITSKNVAGDRFLYNDMVTSTKLSYLFNSERNLNFRGALGINYGSDSGTSLLVSGRLDMTWLDIYCGLDHPLGSNGIYSRNMLILGVQLCPLGKVDVERL